MKYYIAAFVLLVFVLFSALNYQPINNVLFHKGYATCGKCNKTWDVVPSHNTYYKMHTAVFALCEKCWQSLTPEDRVPYYKRMIDKYWSEKDKNENWDLIQSAVLEGY